MTIASVRAADDLREAQDHLRAVSDSMREGLCTLDRIGHVSSMNAVAEQLLGWSALELRGRTLHDATHYRRPDGLPFPIEECPLHGPHGIGGVVRKADDMFVRRDGSGMPVSWALTAFPTATGAHSVIVFTDNTPARLAQDRTPAEMAQVGRVRDLHDALQESRFELFAQPIVDVATGEVFSHELLLRMRERDGTIRTPGAFLPVAESSGLIRDLDRWVIREAARLAGEGHHVELNISAASLGDPKLFDDFEHAVVEHGAEPARMVIELTETALMQDETTARRFIERVRALGCEVALDDFGTGFGGFGYIKRLPVDYLKIDIEFVRDLCTSMASQHVVQAVVTLARAFGHRTVAEGVEDEPTLQMIRAMGVDYAQGFGISRPGPAAEKLRSTASTVGGARGRRGETRVRVSAPGAHPGDRRDHVSDSRNHAADGLDQDAERRDQAADRRDQAADRRDDAAAERDHAGHQRDLVAEQRDQNAERSEGPLGAEVASDRRRLGLARRDAACDRLRSSQDRVAGASERAQAELDRNTALADRRAGANRRTEAVIDRNIALADRSGQPVPASG